MKQFARRALLSGTLLGTLLSGGAALADAPVDSFAMGHAVSEAELGHQRGTFAPGVDINELMKASSNGNSVYSSFTGSNAIEGGAFGGASGIVNVIQNNGNNVIIQNAVIVSITMQ
ncbi:MAG: hypothetical protein ACOY5C_12780 [Pseudomonadota bacterium]|uniref:hypothetical protein n=1 Tax=Thermithiobacillus tepidarius TaxID=929 RepID=UPI00041030AE|nr:hypothetical protein [Thermithiobacillus tepidarius]